MEPHDAARKPALAEMASADLTRLTDPALTTLGAALTQARLAAPRDPELLDRILLALATESSLNVIDRLLELVGVVAPPERAAAVLWPYLEHPTARIRSKAAKIYAASTGDVGWAAGQLDNPDPRVAANVIEALWRAPATHELRELFATAATHANGHVAGNAVVGLFQMGDERAIAALRSLITSPDPALRASGAWVIGAVGWVEGLDEASQMLADVSSKVQRNAIRSVRRLRQLLAGEPAGLRPL